MLITTVLLMDTHVQLLPHGIRSIITYLNATAFAFSKRLLYQSMKEPRNRAARAAQLAPEIYTFNCADSCAGYSDVLTSFYTKLKNSGLLAFEVPSLGSFV